MRMASIMENPAPTLEAELPMHDDLAHACKYVATLGVHGYRPDRQFVPHPDEPTGTVTFIRLREKTYAVTAAHVVDELNKYAVKHGMTEGSFFCPKAPGVSIAGPFLVPPATYPFPSPDLALLPINPELPAYLGKVAFEIKPEDEPEWPLTHGIAVGFPTLEKHEINHQNQGAQVGMRCVHAVARGLTTSGDSDQMQFHSSLATLPDVKSLSGVSGGAIFWSSEDRYGLVGFVKEALDVIPKEGEESFYSEPKVHFLGTRADYQTLLRWADFADANWQKERDIINQRIRREEESTRPTIPPPEGHNVITEYGAQDRVLPGDLLWRHEESNWAVASTSEVGSWLVGYHGVARQCP